MRRFLVLFILLVAVLSACAFSTATATSTPTLVPPTATTAPIVVAVPPALAPAIPALRLCAHSAALPLAVLTVPQQAAWPPAANVRLWWGERPPEGVRAFRLGEEHLVVLAHQGHGPHTNALGLWRIVTGQITQRLSDGGTPEPLVLWLPVPGSAEASRLNAWLGTAPRRGDARLAPSPQVMLMAVGDDPAAIGFVPAAWLRTAAARALPVQVVPLPAPPEAWRAPVLALVPPDAPAEAYTLVACLQQGPGQDALQQVYGNR